MFARREQRYFDAVAPVAFEEQKPKPFVVEKPLDLFFDAVEAQAVKTCGMHGSETHFMYAGISGWHCRKCRVPRVRPEPQKAQA